MSVARDQFLARIRRIAQPADTSTGPGGLSFERLLGIAQDRVFIFEAYRFVLHRNARQAEVDWWLGEGLSRRALLARLCGSGEAKALGTSCPTHWTEERMQELLSRPETEFIPALYKNAVWREPSTAELHRQTQRLKQGIPRALIVSELAGSREARDLGMRLSAWKPKNIEELLALPDGQFLRAAFRMFLWRDPDDAEVAAFEDLAKRGVPRIGQLYRVSKSPGSLEVSIQFPAEWAPKSFDELFALPESEFLPAAFRAMLWRDPDRAEADRYAALLQGGVPRALVLYRIASSGEGRQLGVEFSPEWTPKSVEQLAALPDEAMLEAAYRTFLWRRPDPPGLLRFLAALEAGTPRMMVLYQIASSPEAKFLETTFPEEWTPKSAQELIALPAEQFVSAAYRSILWRDPDPEAETYADTLSRGYSRVSILLQIARSDEAKRIPLRLSGLDALKEPRLQIRWRIRQGAHALVAKTLNNALNLDRRFEASRRETARLVEAVPARVAERFAASIQRAGLPGPNSDSARELVRRIEEVSQELRSLRRELVSRLEPGIPSLSGKLDAYVSQLMAKISALEAPRVVPLADNLLLTRIGEFYSFVPAEDAQLAAILTVSGELEPGVSRLIERLVKTGMTAIDVGANIGLHSLTLARHVGGEGRLFCIEPLPRLAKILRMNLVLNQQMRQTIVEEAAVTDCAGSLPFYPREICGHSSLYTLDEHDSSILVRTERLDDIIPLGVRVDFVKIDAEGAEPLILKGMSRIMEENPNLLAVIEFSPVMLRKANHSPKSFLDQIRSSGFDLELIDFTTGELTRFDERELLAAPSSNLLLRRRL